MQTFYNILDKIKTLLIADDFVNTVTKGMKVDIDNLKQTMFPVSHIQLNDTTLEGNTWRFNITTYHLDIVDFSKDTVTDKFIGNDNEDDIMNTQLAVFARLHALLVKGSDNDYLLDGDPVCIPVSSILDNGLSGWECTFDVLMANVMTKC